MLTQRPNIYAQSFLFAIHRPHLANRVESIYTFASTLLRTGIAARGFSASRGVKSPAPGHETSHRCRASTPPFDSGAACLRLS